MRAVESRTASAHRLRGGGRKDRSSMGAVGGQSAPSPAEKRTRVIVRSAPFRVDFFSQAGERKSIVSRCWIARLDPLF